MPCRFDIDPKRQVAFVVLEGEVTREEVLAMQREAHRDPAFDPGMSQLIDLTRLETRTAPFGLIAELARRAPKSPVRRVAFVVAEDDQRGLAREFGGLVGLAEEQYRLFEARAEALAWLDPDPH